MVKTNGFFKPQSGYTVLFSTLFKVHFCDDALRHATRPSYCGTVGILHYMNASLSKKKMKTVLVLLLATLLSLSEAEYWWTVSYEGEVVVRWYISSAIVIRRCNFDHFVLIPMLAALVATGRDCGHY